MLRMRAFLPLLPFACLFVMPFLPVEAQEISAAKVAANQRSAVRKKMSPTLKKAVGKLKYVSAKKLNTKAEYYIYLQSGSDCANCNREMPGVVKAYKEMKESGGRVDILLICYDSTSETAQAFMKKYGATFPAVLRKDVSPEVLPGFEAARGIPYWQIVRTDTAEATKGRGPALEDWRRKTIEKPARLQPPTATGERSPR